MRDKLRPLLPALIISSALLIITIGAGGIYLHNQSLQHKAQQAAAHALQVQQEQQAAIEQAQAAQETQLQEKKTAAQTTLNNCIAGVNDQVNQAAAQAATVPTTPEAGAIAEQSIEQVDQTYTAQCQATYDATINQLSDN
jgi:hypothetical protein